MFSKILIKINGKAPIEIKVNKNPNNTCFKPFISFPSQSLYRDEVNGFAARIKHVQYGVIKVTFILLLYQQFGNNTNLHIILMNIRLTISQAQNPGPMQYSFWIFSVGGHTFIFTLSHNFNMMGRFSLFCDTGLYEKQLRKE